MILTVSSIKPLAISGRNNLSTTIVSARVSAPDNALNICFGLKNYSGRANKPDDHSGCVQVISRNLPRLS